MTGLRAPGPNVAVRRMSNSEPKWANAKKYVKIVKSYTLTIRRYMASVVAPMAEREPNTYILRLMLYAA